jgi:hypothetical protein
MVIEILLSDKLRVPRIFSEISDSMSETPVKTNYSTMWDSSSESDQVMAASYSVRFTSPSSSDRLLSLTEPRQQFMPTNGPYYDVEVEYVCTGEWSDGLWSFSSSELCLCTISALTGGWWLSYLTFVVMQRLPTAHRESLSLGICDSPRMTAMALLTFSVCTHLIILCIISFPFRDTDISLMQLVEDLMAENIGRFLKGISNMFDLHPVYYIFVAAVLFRSTIIAIMTYRLTIEIVNRYELYQSKLDIICASCVCPHLQVAKLYRHISRAQGHLRT